MSKNIILTYNLIHEEALYGLPIDTIAELDSQDTVDSIKTMMEEAGHKVILVEADENAFENLKKYRAQTDIVFNIAEGIRGESRESHIPCMLEMLGIPYVGSGPLTLAIALNKYRTKEILIYYGIPTPRFQVFHHFDPDLPTLNRHLQYPLIVKLSCEGSSIGLDYDSVVENEKALADKMEYLFKTYHEPVLVEEFLTGREFTIPIIGNNPPITLPIIEVIFFGEKPINIFFPDEELGIFDKLNYTPHKQQTRSVCPAQISEKLKATLNTMALDVYKAFECRDWCRMEIRLDADGNPYVLELNPIAGIAPDYWFPRSAAAIGMDYCMLINKILDTALERYGHI
jgi:D-alanine-D-alanine ligase